MFLRPPLTQCYISVSFSRILKSYGSSVRSWILKTGIPTDPTGSPQHKKNDLDEVQARFGTMTYSEDVDMTFECFAILCCIADNMLKQNMFYVLNNL